MGGNVPPFIFGHIWICSPNFYFPIPTLDHPNQQFPEQKASDIFFSSNLIKDDWCDVNPSTFELKDNKFIHVIDTIVVLYVNGIHEV